ncbi:MAG: hypothetical protein ABNH26_03710 [Celeribacter sp.]|jgi:hypothetical protein
MNLPSHARTLGAALLMIAALAACADPGVTRRGAGPASSTLDAAGSVDFGEVARICGVPERGLGTKSAEAGDYTLYDSQPGTRGPRTLFLTGFDDGCVRAVTGTLAMFGSLQLYDMLMHGAGGAHVPEGATGVAFNTLRQRTCRGECTSRQYDRMSRDTAILSVYDRAGDSRNMELLLHNGDLLATAVN